MLSYRMFSDFPLVFFDRDVLALYLRHSYVPGPYSIYAGVLVFAVGQGAADGDVRDGVRGLGEERAGSGLARRDALGDHAQLADLLPREIARDVLARVLGQPERRIERQIGRKGRY
mgnify:CR=1 FL=1